METRKFVPWRRLAPVVTLVFPAVVAFVTIPCAHLGPIVLLPLIAAAGAAVFIAVRRPSSSRAHLAAWLLIGICFSGYWMAKTLFTAMPLDEPIDLQHDGAQVVFQPWRFWPHTTYQLRMHLRAPYGRQMIWYAGDPRAEVWFNEPPTVNLTVAVHSRRVISLAGPLSKPLLCGGYRDCATSRDEMLFDCARGNFFRPAAFERHTVVLRTLRGSRFAREFAPRLQIVALRDWDLLSCATSTMLILIGFCATSLMTQLVASRDAKR